MLPLGMNSMQKFVDAGFKLKEIIIKEQHNYKATEYWDNIEKTFLMLAHEYIFVSWKNKNILRKEIMDECRVPPLCEKISTK